MPKALTEYLWIVDGHNLVLNVPELTRLYNQQSKKAARDAAERRLADLASSSPQAVHLVFDGQHFPGGQPGGGSLGRLFVRFVDPPAEADDWIVQLARQEADGGTLVAVATSDRGILARLAGSPPIHRMAVDAFWRETGRHARQLGGGPAPEKPEPEKQSPAEIEAIERAMAKARPAPPVPHREPVTAPPPAPTPAPVTAAAPSAPAPTARREKAPPPPPFDWRAEIAKKKEKGRLRQEKRAKRKGS